MAKTSAEKYLEDNFGRLTFAKALRAERTTAEFTQQELADKIGVTKQAISKFEKGIDFPTAVTVKRIAKVFGMPYGSYVELIVQDFAEKKGFGLIIVKAKGSPKKSQSA